MGGILPIGVDELLTGGVESSRLERKAGANTGPQVLAAVCADAWWDLAEARQGLGNPAADVEHARRRARELAPSEHRFSKTRSRGA